MQTNLPFFNKEKFVWWSLFDIHPYFFNFNYFKKIQVLWVMIPKTSMIGNKGALKGNPSYVHAMNPHMTVIILVKLGLRAMSFHGEMIWWFDWKNGGAIITKVGKLTPANFLSRSEWKNWSPTWMGWTLDLKGWNGLYSGRTYIDK